MKATYILFFLFLTISSFSQKHYLVEYDRINNTESYYELNYDKGDFIQKPIKKPFLEKGDVVKFRSINYNPFVFKPVKINSIKQKTKEKVGSQEISDKFKTVLNLKSNILGNITNEINDLSNSDAPSLNLLNQRGKVTEAEKNKINSLVKLSAFRESMLEAYKTLEQYEKSINCIYSFALTKEQIVDELKSSIAKFDIKKYNKQIRKIEIDFKSISADPNLKKEEIKSDEESFKKLTQHLDSLIESPKNANELLIEVENKEFYSEFTKIIGFDDRKFKDLKGDEQTFLMEFNQQDESDSDSDNNLLQNHDVNLPVKQKGSFNWSTGIVVIRAFNGFKNYEPKYEDSVSIKIVGKATTSSRIAIGTNLLYNIPVKGPIVPQVLFGVSLTFNTTDDYKPINFMLGTGLKFKKFQYLSLFGGFTFCENIKLKQGFELGGIYLNEDYDFEYTQRTFSKGYFIGINLNF